MTGQLDIDPEDDLFERIVKAGAEVAYQDWDSGGPGAGAGRVSVYRLDGRYYALHDAGVSGPFSTADEAIRENGIDAVTCATTEIWIEGRGLVWPQSK